MSRHNSAHNETDDASFQQTPSHGEYLNDLGYEPEYSASSNVAEDAPTDGHIYQVGSSDEGAVYAEDTYEDYAEDDYAANEHSSYEQVGDSGEGADGGHPSAEQHGEVAETQDEQASSSSSISLDKKDFLIDIEVTPVIPVTIDLSSEEERKKRQQRAARFNLDSNIDILDKMQQMKNEDAELLQKKIARAKQYGLEVPQDDSPAGFPKIFHDESLKYLVQIPKGRHERKVNLGDDEHAFEVSAFDPSAPRRWDTVHLFGSKMLVENMKTKDVIQLFHEFGAMRVEWISDYRCNVVFENPSSARRCLLATSRYYHDDVEAAKSYLIDHSIAVDFAEQDLPFVVWREALGLSHSQKSSLSMRIATDLDVKTDSNRAKNSVYYKRNQAYFSTLVQTRAARLAKADPNFVTRQGSKSRLTSAPPTVPTIESSRQQRADQGTVDTNTQSDRKRYSGLFANEASGDEETSDASTRLRSLKIVKASAVEKKWDRGHVVESKSENPSKSGRIKLSIRGRRSDPYIDSGTLRGSDKKEPRGKRVNFRRAVEEQSHLLDSEYVGNDGEPEGYHESNDVVYLDDIVDVNVDATTDVNTDDTVVLE